MQNSTRTSKKPLDEIHDLVKSFRSATSTTDAVIDAQCLFECLEENDIALEGIANLHNLTKEELEFMFSANE